MRRLLLLFAAIWLTACEQPAQNHSSSSQHNSVKIADSSAAMRTLSPKKLIIPGKFIGQINLNENTDIIIKRLGKPDASDAAMGKSLSIWYAKHDTTGHETMIFASRHMGTNDESSRIKQIRITSPWFVTPSGVHVGSSLSEIKERYPVKKTATFINKGEQYSLYQSVKGIAFEIDSTGTCSGIAIWDTASATPGKNYLPFYKGLKTLN